MTTVGKPSFLANDSLLIKSAAIAFLHEDDFGSRSNLRSRKAMAAFLDCRRAELDHPNHVQPDQHCCVARRVSPLFALMSVLERKILGRMQNRYGPNRVGPFGLFQPIADGIKMLIKEDIVPARADKIVHFLAPVVLAAVAILTLGVIPYGRNMSAFTIDGGILFFFAVGSATELMVFMAGWGSNNKYSMLGAMRAI